MSRMRKMGYWIIGGIGAFLILLAISLLLLPRWINLEPVKEKIMADISREARGQVKFQKVDLSFFPRPRVVIHQGSLSIPGKVTGALESVTVYPAIRPLFRGNVEIGLVQIEALNLRLELPKKSPEKRPSKPFSLETFQENLKPVLASLGSTLPGGTVEIENGKVSIEESGHPLFSFQNIHAHVALLPEAVKLDLNCKSNLAKAISMKALLDPRGLKAGGDVVVTGLRLGGLMSQLSPMAAFRVGDSGTNLKLHFEADEHATFRGETQVSTPSLMLEREGRRLVLKGVSLKGAYQMEGGKTTVSLTQLRMEVPQINLSGKLHIDRSVPTFRSEFEGKDLDVRSTWEAILAVAPDVEAIQNISKIVREGRIPRVTMSFQGRSIDDLGKIENMVIKGGVRNGQISIPGLSLDIEGVGGELVVSKGTLKGEQLQARVGNTRGQKGTMLLGLKGKNPPFHLDVPLQADLAELAPLLKRLVKDESFREELSRITDLKGSAQGRLILGEGLSSAKVRAEVSALELLAGYQRIPYHVEIMGGGFSYDEDKGNIGVTNLTGKLGKSSFSGLTAQLGLQRAPFLEVQSGKFLVVLDEIHTWFLSFGETGNRLSENIRSLKGVLEITELSLQGPLSRPSDWRLETKGNIKELAAEGALLPGPVGIIAARLEATPDKLSFRDAEVRTLDASLRLSGALNGYREGVHSLEATFDGTVGPQGVEKVSTLAQLPPEFRVRPPVSMEGQVGWEKSGKTSLRAKVAVQGGPRVSIGLLSSAETVNIKQLLIEDETSQASASFSLGRKEFRLDFKGQLKKTTLDRLLLKNELLIGWISGDFDANILIDQPLGSTAHGRIQGTGLHYYLPVPVKLPIVLESVTLDVKGRKVNVDAGLSAPEDRHMRLAGDVDLSGKEILVDMNLTMDGIHWEEVETAVKEEEKRSPPGKGEKRKLPPVGGILRVRSDYLAYGKYSLRPFHADVSFSGDDVSVAVREANLCGISTPGTVEITPQEVGLKINPASRAVELAPTLRCMFGEKEHATGIFDLKGEITARGKPEELVQSLKGNFEFNGKKGNIFRDPVLLKIFALLHVGQIFIGQPTDLGKEGFGYKSINVKGSLQNGKLLLEEAVLDGPSMDVISKGEIDLINETIDLSVFVAPLKTLDRILKYIPILGHVLGGSLSAIPLRVKGNLNDPEVTPLDPAMIGEDLFGIVKRTLGLPFNIIQPLFPGKKKK